jgi:hypothetical protein
LDQLFSTTILLCANGNLTRRGNSNAVMVLVENPVNSPSWEPEKISSEILYAASQSLLDW